MADGLYLALLALFLTHELDAVQRHEWRLIPGLRSLPEPLAAGLFIWAHIPLIGLILWGSFWLPEPALFRNGLAGFAILHVGLHMAFARHPANEFTTLGAKALIGLTGLSGAAYIGVQL